MKTQTAFTLIEMLIALSILVIISAIALPSLHVFWERAEDGLLQDQLLRAIHMAKVTALATHMPVALCRSDHLSDLPVCSEGQADHVLVFINENADGKVKDKEHMLMLKQLQLQHGNLYWRSFPFYRRYLLMRPIDLLNSDNGAFWYCHAHSLTWAIFISKSGRARVVYPDQNGDIKDGSGERLLC